MRRLLLLRHSKAERSQPGEADLDRPLIDRGRQDAKAVGAYLVKHALAPERVLVSPSARTQETWKHAASAFRSPPPASTIERLYNATQHAIFTIIKDAPAGAQRLLVVGHNPGLHELALSLIASGDIEAREQLGEKLPTSGLVVIDFAVDQWSELHPQSGRLERFVSPKSLHPDAF
jgi:phosphohistidine phosphatase